MPATFSISLTGEKAEALIFKPYFCSLGSGQGQFSGHGRIVGVVEAVEAGRIVASLSFLFIVVIAPVTLACF